MSAYKLEIVQSSNQEDSDRSFRGGVPNMPAELALPKCKLCGADQTFFFQVAFPEKHIWNGWVMCVFNCTACSGELSLFNQLEPVDDPASLPDNYLDEYQDYFKVIVYPANSPNSIMRKEARRVLKFERIVFEKLRANDRSGVSKIGGKPYWSYDELIPGMTENTSYMGGKFVFIGQIADWYFPALDDAPPQAGIGEEWHTKFHSYQLLLSSFLSFFGTTSPLLNPPRVWIFRQRG